MCWQVKLPENTDFVEENVSQMEKSSVNTSFISITHSKHLKLRPKMLAGMKIACWGAWLWLATAAWEQRLVDDNTTGSTV